MPLWRVIPFSDTNLLAVELRDAELLQAKFAVVDPKNGQVLLPPTAGPEPWWAGLQGAAQEQLYVHVFHKQPQVGVSGLAALCSNSGREQWQQKGMALRGVTANGLLAQPAQDPEGAFVALDPISGRIIADGQGQAKTTATAQQETVFPVSYSPENPHYATLQQFLELKLHLRVEGPIEYSETDNYILFSIHLTENERLMNYLIVFENNGHLRFRKKLAGNLQGYATDTFFLFCGKAICVQDGTNLLLIDIQK